MKIIYAFRHGQTDWNKQSRIQGHLDVPLNEAGRAEARKLGKVLKGYSIEAFLTSDLERARETAELVAEAAGLSRVKIVTDERLRETHFGTLQGMTREEIELKHGSEFSHRLRTAPLNDAHAGVIGSETAITVYQRASEALFQFLAEEGHHRIAVSTHGGVLRRLVASAAGNLGYPAPIPNAVLYPFRADLDRSELILENQMEWGQRTRSSS